MNKEEIIKKWGTVKLVFDSYWKFEFFFYAKKDNIVFQGSYGGDSDDIYRYGVESITVIEVKDFEQELKTLRIWDVDSDVLIFEYRSDE